MSQSDKNLLEVAERPTMTPAQQDWIRACQDDIWVDLMLRLTKSAPVDLSKPIEGKEASPEATYYRKRLVISDYGFFVRDTEVRATLDIQELLPTSRAIVVVIATSWELGEEQIRRLECRAAVLRCEKELEAPIIITYERCEPLMEQKLKLLRAKSI
ncbi:hypothetical protein PG985_008503 [Apiospora marii]|uniref:uncharacterized protein n=1 Tax=Apiospora marii TaxID=335849 RepID=UPI00312E759C